MSAQELIVIPKAKYDMLMTPQTTKMTSQLNSNPMTSSENVDSDSQRKDVTDMLKYTIPSKCQRKAEGLLNFIIEHGQNILNWDENGQLMYHGKIIQESHIIDLKTDALTQNKNQGPSGYKEFYDALKEIHIPMSFIINTNRKSLMTVSQN